MGLGLSQASAAPATTAQAITTAATRAPAVTSPGPPFFWYPPCDQLPVSRITYGDVCTLLGTPWTATGVLQSNTQALWCWPGFNQLDAWTVTGTGRRTDAGTRLFKFITNNPPGTTDHVEGELITITNLSSGTHTYTPALDCFDSYIPPKS
jgi:hypothetical protein